MFNIGDMIEQATEFLKVGGLEELANVGQMLSEAGLDNEALAQMAPDEAHALLENAGLDPELFDTLQSSDVASALFGGRETQ